MSGNLLAFHIKFNLELDKFILRKTYILSNRKTCRRSEQQCLILNHNWLKVGPVKNCS